MDTEASVKRGTEGEERKEKVRMRGDLSDHVAGANGVSNGVGQSLPALKYERAGRPVSLLASRERV